MRLMGKENHFNAVLFDLDGTLVDTAEEICAAINLAMGKRLGASVSVDQVRNWIGDGTSTTLRRAIAASLDGPVDSSVVVDHAAAIEVEFKAHYLSLCGTKSRLYDGVADTLQLLSQADVKMGVVTNKESTFTDPLLASLNIRRFFATVICGDMVTHKKPHPAPILQCVEAMRCSIKQSVLIGDSRTDVLTARNAAIAIWAVTYGYNQGRPIQDEHPDRVLTDFREIAELLASRATTA